MDIRFARQRLGMEPKSSVQNLNKFGFRRSTVFKMLMPILYTYSVVFLTQNIGFVLVPSAEEKQGPVHRLAEGLRRGQHQTVD